MKHKSRCTKQRKHSKTRLRLPDLEFSKTAVLNSLSSADGQRGYSHAIDEFVDWYCSEPRLALNGSSPLSQLLRSPAACARNHQPALRCRSAPRLRGRRLRFAELRPSRWDSPS